MRSEQQVEKLIKKIENKLTLTDYYLGVLSTLKWLKGDPFEPNQQE